jgi:hypothetical protein
MKSTKTLYSIIIAALMLILGSCQKDEIIGGTSVQSMSGEWWLQAKAANGTFPFGPGYFHFSTYNTAANLPTEMWLEDLHTFWDMKGKVTVDLANKAFTATNSQNEYYNITFNITEGKVIPSASKGPVSKALTDSITFKVKFSDDPGTYTLSGYRRTRFAEDDH